jgi:hypothetical protein
MRSRAAEHRALPSPATDFGQHVRVQWRVDAGCDGGHAKRLGEADRRTQYRLVEQRRDAE